MVNVRAPAIPQEQPDYLGRDTPPAPNRFASEVRTGLAGSVQDRRRPLRSALMSESQMTQYPPPGKPDAMPPTAPPPGGYPTYGPGGQAGQGPPPYAYGPPLPGPPVVGPPVHQPGVVPLRPLLLGDIFGGALQTVRRNPRATVGMALVVTFLFMLVPIVATLALGTGNALPSFDMTESGATTSVVLGDLGVLLPSVISGVFSALSSIVITGLIVRVVEQAVVGRKISAAEAWASSKGRLLRLLLLTLLVAAAVLVLIGVPAAIGLTIGLAVGSTVLTVLLVVLGTLAGLGLTFFLYVRYVLLAAPALVLEGIGVRASLRRAGELSRGQFWRIFGIYLLASLAASLVSQVVAIPFAVLGAVSIFALPESWALAGMMLTSHVATILTGAVIGPFTAGIVALQYLDQRFRKEGLDIELLERTLGPSAPGQER